MFGEERRGGARQQLFIDVPSLPCPLVHSRASTHTHSQHLGKKWGAGRRKIGGAAQKAKLKIKILYEPRLQCLFFQDTSKSWR